MDNLAYSQHLIEEMNRYYEARAPWHDAYMSYESAESMERQLQAIIADLESAITGKRILEIACGTGNWTQVLARRASAVVAVDVSPRALRIASTKLEGLKNVQLVQADAYDLSQIDNSFAVLFAADWWSHIPLKLLPQFLSTSCSKVVPGGLAIFTDMTLSDYFQKEPCRYDSDGNRISRRKLPDGSAFEVVKNFPSDAEIKDHCADVAPLVDFREYAELSRWMAVLEIR